MALADPLVMTWDGVVKNLVRLNQDNNSDGTKYYLEDGVRKFTVTVKHTIPGTGKAGESHLIRLDVEVYDVTFTTLLRVASAWAVIRTDEGIQLQEESEDAAEALVTILSAGNITKLVGRQS